MSSSEFVVSGITLVYVARTIAPSGVQCMKAHAIYLVFKDFAFSGVKSLSLVYLHTII